MVDKVSGRARPEHFAQVRDEQQAKLLTDPASLHYFKPFIARTRTVSQAAAEVGCKLDTMLYRVKTFLAADLLEIARLEPRAGRAIKHYRSVADAYLIPQRLTPYADIEERLRKNMQGGQDALMRAVARCLRNTGREGRRIYRNESSGEVWEESAGPRDFEFDFIDAESRRAHFERQVGPVAEVFNDEFQGTDEEARAFLLEFFDLWFRYRRQAPAEARATYTFSFGLAPIEE